MPHATSPQSQYTKQPICINHFCLLHFMAYQTSTSQQFSSFFTICKNAGTLCLLNGDNVSIYYKPFPYSGTKSKGKLMEVETVNVVQVTMVQCYSLHLNESTSFSSQHKYGEFFLNDMTYYCRTQIDKDRSVINMILTQQVHLQDKRSNNL